MGGFPILKRFLRGTEAVSAVEFGFLLPVMLVIVLGGYEYSNLVAVNRKLTITTRALADLTTQYQQVTSSDVNTIMSASAQILIPYSNANLQVLITEFYVKSPGVVSVVWSQGKNIAALNQGDLYLIPLGVASVGSYVISCRTYYTYNPVITFAMPQSRILTDQIYMSPRRSDQITYSS